MQTPYFRNIKGLNFLAASSIIFYHLVIWPTYYGMPAEVSYLPLVSHMAHICVSLFLVLFGFVITHQLLEQKEAGRKPDLRRYYAGRIRRVWPLYYFILIVTFFVLPHFHFSLPGYPEHIFDHYYSCLLLCIFLMPNVGLKIFCPDNLFASPLWIIGVMEPLYFLWPWLIGKSRNVFKGLLIVALMCMVVKAVLAVAVYRYQESGLLKKVYDLWNISSVSSVPIGGMVAYILLFSKHTILNIFYDLRVRLFLYIAGGAVLLSNITFPFYYEFYSVVLAVWVLNISQRNYMITLPGKRIRDYIGRLTYGYYGYHIIVMGIVSELTKQKSGMGYYLMVYVGSLVVAIASYELFEKRFLDDHGGNREQISA